MRYLFLLLLALMQPPSLGCHISAADVGCIRASSNRKRYLIVILYEIVRPSSDLHEPSLILVIPDRGKDIDRGSFTSTAHIGVILSPRGNRKFQSRHLR